MAINDCLHSFAEMAQKVLPDLMDEMYTQMKDPISVSDFVIKGTGTQTLLKKYKRNADFRGCYVLIEGNKPIYVGISGQVFRRIMLHCRGNTHYDANLAYAIANKQKSSDAKMSRAEQMKDEEFVTIFKEVRQRIQQCSFASIPIDNDLTLYLFEAYCAMKLDTCEWNTFRTH